MVGAGQYVSRLGWVLASVVVAASMLWPAALNGRPSYFPDSIGYFNNGRAAFSAFVSEFSHPRPLVEGSNASGDAGTAVEVRRPDQVVATRAVAYAVFAFLTGWPRGAMFLTVLVQSLMVTTLLLMWWRRLAPDLTWKAATVAGLAMAVATSASWIASFAMPDIFAGAALLALLILAFPATRPLGLVSEMFLALIIAAGFAVHVSHIPLLVAATSMAIALQLWTARRHRETPDWRTVGWLAAPVGLGVAGVIAISLIGFSEVSLAPKRMPAVLARSIEDGPARWYLERHCATEKYVVCEVLPVLPDSQIAVLFGPTGLGQRATPAQMDAIRAEEPIIVARAIRAYPWLQAKKSSEAFLLQTFQFGAFDLSFSGQVTPGAGDELVLTSAPNEPLFPRGSFDPLIYLGVAAATLYLLRTVRRRRRGEAEVLILTMACLLTNAAVTGILSAVANRYQARVIWILPAIAIGFYLARRPGSRHARRPDPGGLT